VTTLKKKWSPSHLELSSKGKHIRKQFSLQEHMKTTMPQNLIGSFVEVGQRKRTCKFCIKAIVKGEPHLAFYSSRGFAQGHKRINACVFCLDLFVSSVKHMFRKKRTSFKQHLDMRKVEDLIKRL